MQRRIKKKQHDITDCGAACLASVAAHYRLKLPISRIRQYASTDKKGTNMLGMVEAARKIGFAAKAVKAPFESLTKIPLPAIAHLQVKEILQHYVVIYEVSMKHIVVMDPGTGDLHRKTYDEFKQEWTGILLLLVPDQGFNAGDKTVSVIGRFLSLVRPHRSIMTQALSGAAIYSLLGLSTSFFVEKIVDHVLVDGNINLLHIMGVAMVVILLLRIFIGSMKSILALKTGQMIDGSLILGYYKHLLALPQNFFDTMRVGEIISRVNDAVKIRSFINNVALDMTVNIMIVWFTLTIMFLNSWQLALIVFATIPAYASVYLIYNKLNKKNLRDIMENAADLESHLIESVSSVSTIKRFGVEEYAGLKTEIRFVRLLNTSYMSTRSSIMANGVSELIAGVITIALLWVGSVEVINQEMTPGTLISFYALLGYLISPVSSLIMSNQTLQDALIASDRLFQIVDLEREQNDENKVILTTDIIGDIKFKNVSFRYGSRNQVLENFSVTLKKGEITAIVGESGSGKTTLMALLQNIYPIQGGSIEIGDYNLSHININSLRNVVGTVPQQVDLFAGTVIENIALGSFEPDMKKIIKVCNDLHILEFIEKLPQGFNTHLGEHGVSLSGGERQRIAVARALYRDPEILILDEATSALDSLSESFIKEVTLTLRDQGKTIILITHRLDTIDSADMIVLLEHGKVAEMGSPADLVRARQKYFQLLSRLMPVLSSSPRE